MNIVFAGATGRTGRVLAKNLLQEDDIRVVAAVTSRHAGRDLREILQVDGAPIPIVDDVIECLAEYQPDILIDFTTPDVAARHALAAVEVGVSPVVGTSGISKDDLARLRSACTEQQVGGAVIANFSFGALLLQQFAARAAQLFPDVEIVERFRPEKKDKPSGTGVALQQLLQKTGGHSVPVHALRLPGSAAHIEIVFGSAGETVTIRHDALDAQAYVTGLLHVVRGVRDINYLETDLARFLPKLPD